jgi:hypothetical protein
MESKDIIILLEQIKIELETSISMIERLQKEVKVNGLG